MTTSPDLRCMMKIRSCGFFWYKATVTLSFPTGSTQLGQLTISRSKVHGGDLKISLDRCGTIPTYVCASDPNNQFTVIYGDRRRCLTVRAATPAIYKAWWSALETAYMSLRLIQMKRALATNFDALPEPELEQNEASGSLLHATADYMPMLQSMSPSSQEDDECENWQSHESPDELVIIDPTAMGSKSKHKPESTSLPTQLWPRTTQSESEQDIEIDEDGSLSNESSHWSSSDSDGSDLSSLIDNDVFDSLPRDVRDLIDDCSVQHSYSPSSSNDSTAVEPFPDDVELLEDCRISRITTENSTSSALSGLFSARRQRGNSDSNTASTAPLTDQSDVLLAVESDMATTKDAFTPSTSTPFERLQTRIAAKSNGDSVLSNSCRADRRATDSRRDRLHRSYKRQHHPMADTEARPPQSLITGRIDEVRVQEVEQFASRRLQNSTRTWKKAIMIERVTKAWTEVARFAFRPNAAGNT